MIRYWLRQYFCVLCMVCILAGQVAAEQGVWREANFEGVKIAYFDAGKQNALTLVFIHGWSCDISFWRLQIPEFSQSYRVIAVDLPGFGKSNKPHDRAYTLEFFAKAIHAVIQDAKTTSPVLIGHSMGYSVVRQYLLSFPGEARAVVNVDGTHLRIPKSPEARAGFEKKMNNRNTALEGPKRKEAVRRVVESTFYGKTPMPLQDEIMAVMTSADVYTANSALRELRRLDQWKEISFDVPCLALYAKAARLPPDHEVFLRRAFPRLAYEMWDDTGHYLMLEKPQRFNAALNRFLISLSR